MLVKQALRSAKLTSMKTITLSPDDRSYLDGLAEEYGLLAGPFTKFTESKFIDLSLPGHVSIIDIGQHGEGDFCWTLYPLGPGHRIRRRCHGFANTFALALGDAEGMLRHYLRNTVVAEVTEVWGAGIFERLGGSGPVVARLLAQRKVALCVHPREGDGAAS
jgi:hypothetical protein